MANIRHPSVWITPCREGAKVRYDVFSSGYGVGDCQQRFLIYVFYSTDVEMLRRQYTELVLGNYKPMAEMSTWSPQVKN